MHTSSWICRNIFETMVWFPASQTGDFAAPVSFPGIISLLSLFVDVLLGPQDLSLTPSLCGPSLLTHTHGSCLLWLSEVKVYGGSHGP